MAEHGTYHRQASPDGSDGAAAAPPGALYTCPMHPQIRVAAPGSCPICGMSLELVEVSEAVAPDPELADMSRRFWVALVLALPVFCLEMGGHIPRLGLVRWVPERWSIWLQFAPAVPNSSGFGLSRQ